MENTHTLEDIAHAEMMNSFVSWLGKKKDVKIYCEVPYNHYGDRGVVDVLAMMLNGQHWQGVGCELKPRFFDLGETIRQVHRAQLYFQTPDTMTAYGKPILRFPLILKATDENLNTAMHYQGILNNVPVYFFDDKKAFRNDIHRAWYAAEKERRYKAA